MTPPLSPKKKERGPRAEPASDLVAAVRSLKRKVEENLDQLALVHGVLEELCERQEALASWQMEYAKRTLSLGEAQWHALNAFSRRPGSRAKAALPPLPVVGEGERGKVGSGKGRAKVSSESKRSRRVESAKPVFPPEDDGFDDSLDDATAFLMELSGDLSRRKDIRRRVMEERAMSRGEADDSDSEPTSGDAHGGTPKGVDATAARTARARKGKARASEREEEAEPLESILVLPEKTEFH